MRLLYIILLVSTSAWGAPLKPFTTDGCSAFPEGTLEQQELWMPCCVEHDRAYWLGGSYQQRLDADEALKECVNRVGEPEIALLMLTGVRVGGSPYWITEYRWGYGWPYWDGFWPRGYKALEGEELEQALR